MLKMNGYDVRKHNKMLQENLKGRGERLLKRRPNGKRLKKPELEHYKRTNPELQTSLQVKLQGVARLASERQKTVGHQSSRPVKGTLQRLLHKLPFQSQKHPILYSRHSRHGVRVLPYCESLPSVESLQVLLSSSHHPRRLLSSLRAQFHLVNPLDPLQYKPLPLHLLGCPHQCSRRSTHQSLL